jgi:hypothetical protein
MPSADLLKAAVSLPAAEDLRGTRAAQARMRKFEDQKGDSSGVSNARNGSGLQCLLS